MDASSDTPQPPSWLPPSPAVEHAAAPALVLEEPPAAAASVLDNAPDTFSLVAARPPLRKRKLGLVVGLAGIVAVIGAGAFVVMNRGTDEGEAYSLPAAAEAASESSTVEYQVTMDVNGKQFADIAIAYDTALQRERLTATVDSIGSTFDAIVDVANHIGYVDASAFAALPGVSDDVKWLRFDLEAASALDFGTLLEQQSGNPLDIAPLFLHAIDTTDLGFDEVGGEKVKHYAVTVDGAAGLAEQPGLADRLEALGGVPDTITYDVYVNENNELRRMTFEIEVGGVSTAVDIVIASVGEPVSIDIPPPSDVNDVTELFGGIGN